MAHKTILLARRHGEEHLEVVADTSVPPDKQREAFKRATAAGTDEEYDLIELWSRSEGCVKSRRLRRPDPATPPDTDDQAAREVAVLEAEEEAKRREEAELIAKEETEAKAKAEAEAAEAKAKSDEEAKSAGRRRK